MHKILPHTSGHTLKNYSDRATSAQVIGDNFTVIPVLQ